MSLFTSFRSLVSTLFHRSQINVEMEEELRSHIQHRADDLERSGLPRAEAERRARIEFGGYQQYKEESHEALGGQFLESLLQDIRFGLRMLRKNPGFTAVAVLTLAFGIGANAIVFSVLNALIIHPLNVPQSQSLFMIERGPDTSPMQSYPDYVDLRDRNHSFDSLAAYDMAPAGLDAGGKPSPVGLYETSGNYFDVLNVQPYLGRFFHHSDEHGPNGSPYIVLGYGFWQSHFQGDHGVVGRMVQLNQHPFTILGVAPPEFRGSELFFAPDFWVPIMNTEQVQGTSSLEARYSTGIWLVGHLKSGVTPAQATGDLASVAANSVSRCTPTIQLSGAAFSRVKRASRTSSRSGRRSHPFPGSPRSLSASAPRRPMLTFKARSSSTELAMTNSPRPVWCWSTSGISLRSAFRCYRAASGVRMKTATETSSPSSIALSRHAISPRPMPLVGSYAFPVSCLIITTRPSPRRARPGVRSSASSVTRATTASISPWPPPSTFRTPL